jgi:Spy/CpxP family protein refolding chaperone
LSTVLAIDVFAAAKPAQEARPSVPAAAKPADAHRKWWTDQRVRAELGITDRQSQAVEGVWQQNLRPLLDLRHTIDAMDRTIAEMIQNAVSERTLVMEIDRAESARAALNEGRTLMLYRMNRVLTVDQRAKLKAMWEREHGHLPPGHGAK